MRRKKRERERGGERESDQKAARSEAKTTTSLSRRERVRVCLSSARFKDVHEGVICFDSQSHPSHQSPPPPSSPPLSIGVIDFSGNKASTPHKITHP